MLMKDSDNYTDITLCPPFLMNINGSRMRHIYNNSTA